MEHPRRAGMGMDDGMLLLPQNDDGRSIRPDTPNQPRRRPLPSTLHPHQTLIRPSISPECSRSTPPKGVWDARKVIFITSRSCLSILRLRRRLQTSARLPTHQTQRAPPIDRSIDRFRSGRSTWCRALCVHGLSAQSIDRNRSIKACGIPNTPHTNELAFSERCLPTPPPARRAPSLVASNPTRTASTHAAARSLGCSGP